jgi:hypothetical protein
MYVSMYVCVCVFVCMYVCKYVCVCMYVCMMHVYYVHTHTYAATEVLLPDMAELHHKWSRQIKVYFLCIREFVQDI